MRATMTQTPQDRLSGRKCHATDPDGSVIAGVCSGLDIRNIEVALIRACLSLSSWERRTAYLHNTLDSNTKGINSGRKT